MRTRILLGIISLFILSAGQLRGDDGIRLHVSIEDAVGESSLPVLLVFFAIDCHVCWGELFEMKHFIEENDLPVLIVGVTKESPEELESFLKKYSYRYPVVNDVKKKLYRKFNVSLEPHRVLILGDHVVYQDDPYEDFFRRREKAKKWLLQVSPK